MGQVIHLVLFESVHSITRYGSKSKCPKSAPSSKIIFNGAALFCEIATQVCNIAKKAKMTFQESSDFDCATFAKNWNWRIGKNRIGNRGNARAFLLVPNSLYWDFCRLN